MRHSDIWRKLFALSPDGLLELTPDGRLADVNGTFLAWLGLPRQAAMGHMLAHFLSGDAPPFPLPGPIWAGFVRLNGPKGVRVLSLTLTRIDAEYPYSQCVVGVARMTPDVMPLKETLRRKLDELDTVQLVTINAFARLAEFNDMHISGHLERVRLYTYTLATFLAMDGAEELALTENAIVELSRCAVLHDVGKAALPERILAKPDPLPPADQALLQTHPVLGERFLAEADAELQRLMGVDATFLGTARQIAMNHHERFDGKGYPTGLKGEAIPLCARIVALADTYDYLTTRGEYQPNWTHAKARHQILSEAGGQFDPKVVTAFTAAEDLFVGVLESVHGESTEERR